jgi:hypothetical protein
MLLPIMQATNIGDWSIKFYSKAVFIALQECGTFAFCSRVCYFGNQ